MANRVNPPKQLVLPESIAQNMELKKAFDDRDFILFQLWARSGSGSDFIDEITIDLDELTIQVDLNTQAIIDNTQSIIDNAQAISDNTDRIEILESKLFVIINTSTSITASGNQIIICNNTSQIDITLNPSAVSGDEVHIKRRNKKVNVIGTIDGLTNKLINIKNFSIHLVFDGIDWSQI